MRTGMLGDDSRRSGCNGHAARRGLAVRSWRGMNGALLSAACFTSCSGSQPKPAEPPPAAAVVASAPPAPDVSEVPAPAHLAALMRWRNAQATFETIYQWTGIHLSPADLAGEAYDKALADTLAYDAPIDAAVAIDEKATDSDMAPHVAVSFGVRSLEDAHRAVQAVGTVTEGRPGEYRVRLKPNKRHGERAFCSLTAAAGEAPARFICGRRERDVDALAPFLARTLPRRDLGRADLHVQLLPPAIVDAYGTQLASTLHFGAMYAPRKLQIGESTFDRAIERAATSLADEIGLTLHDADEVGLDVTLTPDHAALDLALKLRAQQSWMAGSLASVAPRAAPPPAIFWRLPQSATGAGYQYAPEAGRYAEVRRTLTELLDGWLLHEGVSAADRTPLVSALGEIFAYDTPRVNATGAFAETDSAGKASSAAAEAFPGWQRGWSLTGFASAVPAADLLNKLVTGVNRPKVQTVLKNSLSELGNVQGQKASGAPSANAPLPLRIRSVAPPKGLPVGSVAYELTYTRPSTMTLESSHGVPTGSKEAGRSASALGKASSSEQSASTKMHIVVVPSARETWMGLARDRDKLVPILLGVLENAKNAQTLDSRSELEPLRNSHYVGATFLTPAGLLNSWQAPLLQLLGVADAEKRVSEVRSALDTAPHKGQTPMLCTTTVEANGLPHVHAHLDVPKGVIEDVIVAATMSLMQGIGRP